MDFYSIYLIIKFTALIWLIYNGWLVYIAPRNMVEVGVETQTNCPLQFAFSTYMNVRDFYLRLSPGHKKYEMTGTSLTEDVVIEIWETAGFQFVKHQYRVVELVQDERMRLVSEKSQVTVLGVFKGETRSEVEFRFHAINDNQTNLGITIQIIFPNWYRHLLARLFFTQAIWKSHARAELNALAKIMEEAFVAKSSDKASSQNLRVVDGRF